MGIVYKDRAGNRLYINNRDIYARNRQGKLVTRRGVMTLLKRASKAGKIKYKR